MGKCKTCRFAYHDPVLKKAKCEDDVVGCNMMMDYEAGSCSLHEEIPEFEVGDEIRSKARKELTAIIVNKTEDAYQIFDSLGCADVILLNKAIYWEKTGNNYNVIVQMFLDLEQKIRLKADKNFSLFY